MKDIIKGACIGISNIIPGFSGGTMAVMLHAYDRIVFDIADITKHPLKAIKDIIWLILGMLVGMCIAIITISLLLDKFPFPTIMFFVGLIIGSIPFVFKEGNTSKKTPLEILWIIPGIVIIVIMAFINAGDKSTSIGFIPLLLIFIIGILASATMIVPGVSGSLTLMAFGYYTVVIDDIKSIAENLLHLSNVWHEIIFMAVFAVGCIVGLLLVSKLIRYLISKWRGPVYFFITGLLLASIFTIIYTVAKSDEYSINFGSIGMWICSVLLLITGIIIPLLMEYLSSKHKNESEVE